MMGRGWERNPTSLSPLSGLLWVPPIGQTHRDPAVPDAGDGQQGAAPRGQSRLGVCR